MFNCITTRSISCSPRLRSRLIKFRYGSSRDQQTASSTAQPKGEVPKSGMKHEEAIWDFQIAPRYRRKPLDEEEIAVINNGGPLGQLQAVANIPNLVKRITEIQKVYQVGTKDHCNFPVWLY